MGVGVQHDEPGERDRARDDAGCQRARAKAGLQLAVASAGGVGREEHGGEIGGSRDREHADEDRRRVPSSWRTGVPAALPTGTRREAIAPTIVPSANGVRIEETREDGVDRALLACSTAVPARSA